MKFVVRFRKKTWLTACALAVIAAQSPHSFARVTCEQVEAWAKEQKTLPEKLADVAKLEIPYRRAVFERLSAEKKVNLWKEHLETQKNGLTGKKREVLEMFVKHLNPELFSNPEQAKKLPPVTLLHEVFGKEDASVIFGTLGAPDAELTAALKKSRQFKTASVKTKKTVQRKIASDDTEDHGTGDPTDGGGGNGGLPCTCNSSYDFCSSGWYCYNFHPGSCAPTNSGCGLFWSMSCNSRCSTF